MISRLRPAPDQRSTSSPRTADGRANLFSNHGVGSDPPCMLRARASRSLQVDLRFQRLPCGPPRGALIWGGSDMLEGRGKSMDQFNARDVLDRYVYRAWRVGRGSGA